MGEVIRLSDIPGWGADKDNKDRPGYPMWSPVKETGAHWKEPPQQTNFKDFHSIERPGPSKVFGTSCPPKGVSGLIRKFAFQFNESNYLHWLPLLFADRVNEVEGIVEDLLHGHIPNYFAESGFAVDLKYNKPAFVYRVTKVALVASLLPLGIYFLTRPRSVQRI